MKYIKLTKQHREVFEALDDSKAGQLIKHLLDCLEGNESEPEAIEVKMAMLAIHGAIKTDGVIKQDIDHRKEAFEERATIQGWGILSQQELIEFLSYWTEHNPDGKKMRFEMAKNQPFNIKRRMATWKKNAEKFAAKESTSQMDKLSQIK